MKMTGGKFVLDTNIIAALLKGESGIADKIDKATAIFIPVIVLGELYYGALYSSRVEKIPVRSEDLLRGTMCFT
jgi:tRNA(fMet)-specific endonuclease VapC